MGTGVEGVGVLRGCCDCSCRVTGSLASCHATEPSTLGRRRTAGHSELSGGHRLSAVKNFQPSRDPASPEMRPSSAP